VSGIEANMTRTLEPITPEDALQLYLDHRSTEVADSTYRAHRIRLQHFVRWCDEQGIENLNTISGRDLHQYRIWRRNEGQLNRVSVRTQMSTLKQFVRFSANIDAMSDGIEEAVDVPELEKGENARDVMIPGDRIEEILNRLRTYNYASRRHVLVRLLWVTACRLGAVRALDVEDVDLDEQTIEFRHRCEYGTPLKNKNGGERIVAIDDTTTKILADWITDRRPDVTDEHGRDALLATNQSGRMGKTTIRRNIYRVTTPQFVGRDCTCDVDDHNKSSVANCNESVSPHALRRSAITAMLRRGNNKSLVSGRCDVSRKVLNKHYDEMTDGEKMEYRREEMDWI
jgi:site-specific recombinase XerD